MFSLTEFASSTDEVGAEEGPTTPSLKYHAHDGTTGISFRNDSMNRAIADAIGSVAFHPLHPLLLSVSGSRHFDEIDSNVEERPDSGSDDSVLGDDEISRDATRVPILGHRHRPQPSVRDDSFRLWNVGKPPPCLGKD
jgi:hypothetical protein